MSESILSTTVNKRKTTPTKKKLSGLAQSYSDENTLNGVVPVHIGTCKIELYSIAAPKNVTAKSKKSTSSGGK